jgi:hypothetical protein
MEKTPTAEEIMQKNLDPHDCLRPSKCYGMTLDALIEFARLHCEAQLKAILEKATIETKCYEFGDMDEYHVINKDSIINAYPLTNIK